MGWCEGVADSNIPRHSMRERYFDSLVWLEERLGHEFGVHGLEPSNVRHFSLLFFPSSPLFLSMRVILFTETEIF